ncbi:MAG: TVP38/TMEM64 family protein, partial [Atopococcus tabaci]|nr:TVP38/TMEM64 family protein [Atopococcus tabaci]
RIVPVIPYTVENYVFGLTSIKAWEYLYLSLIFIIPGTFIYVNIGAQSLDIASTGFIIAVGLLVLISIVPIGVERWRNKKKKDKAEINEEEKN